MAILFINQCTNLDFSFLSATRGLVGETWLLDLKLHGDLNEIGMLIDFSDIKPKIITAVHQLLDHKLWVPTLSPCCTYRHEDTTTFVDFKPDKSSAYIYKGPSQGVALLPLTHIDEQTVILWLTEQLASLLSEAITIELNLYPQTIPTAYYHYTHGLKEHAGDCQRIAHGHRSPIFIYLNEQRDIQTEQRFAQLWQDQYLANQSDRIQQFLIEQVLHYQYAYHGSQGYFELTLPAKKCYEISTQTTVELLAMHACQLIQTWHPKVRVRVDLYEGLNKGSIALSK